MSTVYSVDLGSPKRSVFCQRCARKQAHAKLMSRVEKKRSEPVAAERIEHGSDLTYLIPYYRSMREDKKWKELRKKLDDDQSENLIEWINKCLDDSHSISNLYVDLSDGLKVVFLLEALYKCHLKKENPITRLHKMKNFQSCIDFMELVRQVKCIGITSSGLVEGNRKILLGFLFLIRHDYEYKFCKELFALSNERKSSMQTKSKITTKIGHEIQKIIEICERMNQLERVDSLPEYHQSFESESNGWIISSDLDDNKSVENTRNIISYPLINSSYDSLESSDKFSNVKSGLSSKSMSDIESIPNSSQTDSLVDLMKKIQKTSAELKHKSDYSLKELSDNSIESLSTQAKSFLNFDTSNFEETINENQTSFDETQIFEQEGSVESNEPTKCMTESHNEKESTKEIYELNDNKKSKSLEQIVPQKQDFLQNDDQVLPTNQTPVEFNKIQANNSFDNIFSDFNEKTAHDNKCSEKNGSQMNCFKESEAQSLDDLDKDQNSKFDDEMNEFSENENKKNLLEEETGHSFDKNLSSDEKVLEDENQNISDYEKDHDTKSKDLFDEDIGLVDETNENLLDSSEKNSNSATKIVVSNENLEKNIENILTDQKMILFLNDQTIGKKIDELERDNDAKLFIQPELNGKSEPENNENEFQTLSENKKLNDTTDQFIDKVLEDENQNISDYEKDHGTKSKDLFDEDIELVDETNENLLDSSEENSNSATKIVVSNENLEKNMIENDNDEQKIDSSSDEEILPSDDLSSSKDSQNVVDSSHNENLMENDERVGQICDQNEIEINQQSFNKIDCELIGKKDDEEPNCVKVESEEKINAEKFMNSIEPIEEIGLNQIDKIKLEEEIFGESDLNQEGSNELVHDDDNIFDVCQNNNNSLTVKENQENSSLYVNEPRENDESQTLSLSSNKNEPTENSNDSKINKIEQESSDNNLNSSIEINNISDKNSDSVLTHSIDEIPNSILNKIQNFVFKKEEPEHAQNGFVKNNETLDNFQNLEKTYSSIVKLEKKNSNENLKKIKGDENEKQEKKSPGQSKIKIKFNSVNKPAHCHTQLKSKQKKAEKNNSPKSIEKKENHVIEKSFEITNKFRQLEHIENDFENPILEKINGTINSIDKKNKKIKNKPRKNSIIFSQSNQEFKKPFDFFNILIFTVAFLIFSLIFYYFSL